MSFFRFGNKPRERRFVLRKSLVVERMTFRFSGFYEMIIFMMLEIVDSLNMVSQ